MSPTFVPESIPKPGSARRSGWDLGAFLGLTFAITWGLGVALLAFRPQVEAVIGPIGPLEQSPLFYLAVYAPGLSAIIVSLAFGGRRGLVALTGRLVAPFKPVWLLIGVLGLPFAFLILGLGQRLAGAPSSVDLRALLVSAPLMALTTPALFTDPGGLGEEVGWRGFALPRLVRRMAPLYAGLLLGVIWGVWHLPAFFAQGLVQARMDFGWFLAAIVAMSVFMAWLYVNANGNLIVCGVLPHATFNLMFGAHVLTGDVVKTQAQVMVVLAISIVAACGPSLAGWRKPAAR